MIDDELEQLRRANPVSHATGERLAAPHGAAFREAITAPSVDGIDGQPRRLSVAAAAVALLAVPALLLTRMAGDDVVRTPATVPEPVVTNPVETRPSNTEPGGTELGNTESGDKVEVGVPTTVTTSTSDTPSTTAPTTATPTSAPGATSPSDPSAAPSTTLAVDLDAPITPPTTSPTTPEAAPVPATTTTSPPTPGASAEPDTTAAPPPDTAPTDTTPASTTPVATTPANTTPAGAPPPDTTPATTQPATTTPATTQPASTTPATTTPATDPPVAAATGPFDANRDLLVVTLDFGHLDDGHATVATKELAATFGVDPLVVAGTVAPESETFTHPYRDLMTTVWGTSWLDAGADRANAVSVVAQRWLPTIDAGGRIWVAEGGVSDFTADVLREVQRQRPGLDTSTRLHVIHHSARNEDTTRSGDLDLITAHGDIVRIDDGNDLNGTAGLNGASAEFERLALQGDTAVEWAAAFGYHPATSLDFSDTVTVLHVLGVGLDTVADVDGFARLTMT